MIDLDDQLVSEVSKALGTTTKRDTVHAALREVRDVRRRELALMRMQAAVAAYAFDLELLEDKRSYRR
ncbi:type II toxin-antitoxin system VapB family antitoxin [Nocardia sp. NPDC127526]|uniref:type II toxin-antitoxin system VapB family antitoxin n=1 Tax=Nocardia sp. NPDC127526 TaxID=3345393 RepID=UPI00362FA0F0